jgi:hypothetical protein
MAPLLINHGQASNTKKRGRRPSKKDNKNEEEAQEVLSEKVSAC